MRAFVFVILALGIAGVAFGQINTAFNAWQGTWSDPFGNGGVLYLCVDPEHNTAHGMYSNIGVVRGYLFENTFSGFFYEAGYDRPFGPVSLTISGSSFTGTYSYYDAPAPTPFDQGGTWSSSRSSNSAPTPQQCWTPATANQAAGIYQQQQYVCSQPGATYQNTNQPAVFGTFDRLGDTNGYTPDDGVSFFTSDFQPSDDEPTSADPLRWRPEDPSESFGPNNPVIDRTEDDDLIHVNIIALGVAISADTICYATWKGLYNIPVASGCITRTSSEIPPVASCRIRGVPIVGPNGTITPTSNLLKIVHQEVQDGLSNTPFVLSGGGIAPITGNVPVNVKDGGIHVIGGGGEANSAQMLSLSAVMVLLALLLCFL